MMEAMNAIKIRRIPILRFLILDFKGFSFSWIDFWRCELIEICRSSVLLSLNFSRICERSGYVRKSLMDKAKIENINENTKPKKDTTRDIIWHDFTKSRIFIPHKELEIVSVLKNPKLSAKDNPNNDKVNLGLPLKIFYSAHLLLKGIPGNLKDFPVFLLFL